MSEDTVENTAIGKNSHHLTKSEGVNIEPVHPDEAFIDSTNKSFVKRNRSFGLICKLLSSRTPCLNDGHALKLSSRM